MIYKSFLKRNPNATKVELKVHIKKQVYFSIAFMIGAFFLGGGIGTGLSAKDRIINNNLKIKHRITDSNDIQKDIYLIDSNSAYYFM